ncbi:MAG TPA: four helix bundle protein [Candidatus Bipolaricaulota bacterium]|nr:four helix bundle protein [Candidatus Bipolaricaulota bacterium]
MEKQVINSYKDLIVWQKAMDLVVAVYKLTDKFPREEAYGLTSQMRRSSISIPSNIAEGRRRGTRREYRHFLIVAYSSGAELETQLEIAKRLNFSEDIVYNVAADLLEEIMKILNSMTSSLYV